MLPEKDIPTDIGAIKGLLHVHDIRLLLIIDGADKYYTSSLDNTVCVLIILRIIIIYLRIGVIP